MTKPNPMTEENPKESVALIKLSDLKESPYQGRFLNETTKNDNSRAAQQLDELTASIESSGMMQPIIVRQVADGYEIIDGHRRVMAHKNLGRGQVRAIIKDCTEREAQIMAVVGNLQRKNLTPIELAVTYQKLLDTEVFKDKRELSKAIGKDETYVGDLLNTLNMDTRIIDDLKNENSIKDLRLLRSIRRIEKVDSAGKSQKQFEVYIAAKHQGMSREDLASFLKAKDKPTQKNWNTKKTASGVTLKISTKKMSPETIEKLLTLLDNNMLAILDNLA